MRLQKRLGEGKGGEHGMCRSYSKLQRTPQLMASFPKSDEEKWRNFPVSAWISPSRDHEHEKNNNSRFTQFDIISDSLFLSLQSSVGQRGLSRQLTAPPPPLILYWCTESTS